MISNALIRVVVALCMLAGLAVGPASVAAPTHAMTATATGVMAPGVEMPDDMDCCPKTQSDPRCAKCPLMALCSSPFAEPLADLRLPEIIAITLRRAAPVDEAALAGRRGQPLPEPPRSSV